MTPESAVVPPISCTVAAFVLAVARPEVPAASPLAADRVDTFVAVNPAHGGSALEVEPVVWHVARDVRRHTRVARDEWC